jgi:S-formylglutathione hydrolase FrmB
MPRLPARTNWSAGRVTYLQHKSRVLANNPWGDPSERQFPVYLPAGYEEQAEPYISLWDLAAFTNSGPGHAAWRNHGETLPERLDRLIGQGMMPPAVVVMPDCYTSLGGNQYVNSAALGNYADYLVDELVPFVTAELNVLNAASGRGIFGKSSGGYGALFHAMKYPQTWGAAASHSGDVGFDLEFRPSFPETCLNLERFSGDIRQFVQSFWDSRQPSGSEFNTLMILALAASFDPDPANPQQIRLPFDLRTCTLDSERWQCWLDFDPLNLVRIHAEALRGLRGLYIDVGNQDQYNIQFGTRNLIIILKEFEVPVYFEEFQGSHSGINWRLDHSLPYLAKCLKSATAAAN